MVQITIGKKSTSAGSCEERSNIELDSLGCARVVLPESDLEFLLSIDCEGDAAIEQQKNRMLVEYCLLSGTSSRSRISQKIGINRKTVTRLAKQIEFGWSLGKNNSLEVMRKKTLAFLDLLTRELWHTYDLPATSDATKMMIIGRLLRISDRQMELEGLAGVFVPPCNPEEQELSARNVEIRFSEEHLANVATKIRGYLQRSE